MQCACKCHCTVDVSMQCTCTDQPITEQQCSRYSIDLASSLPYNHILEYPLVLYMMCTLILGIDSHTADRNNRTKVIIVL